MDFRYGSNHQYENVFDDQYEYVAFGQSRAMAPPPFVPAPVATSFGGSGGPPPPYIPPLTADGSTNTNAAAFGPPSSSPNDATHAHHRLPMRHDHRYNAYASNGGGRRSSLRNVRLNLNTNNIPPLHDILTTLQSMPIAQSQYQFPLVALVARLLVGAQRKTFLGILQRVENASSKAMAFNEILQLTRNLANEFPQEFVSITEIEYTPDRNGFIASTQIGSMPLQGRASSKRSARENVCAQLVEAMQNITEAVESIIGKSGNTNGSSSDQKARRSEEMSSSVLEAAKAVKFPTVAKPYEPPKLPVCITINNASDPNEITCLSPASPPGMQRSLLPSKNRIGGIDVAVLIQHKFDQLLTTIPVKYRPYQVLAGIAMTSPLGQAQVISIGTGTKVIRGDHLSLDGTALKDMHAEILSIRGLKRFFLQQLLVWMNAPTRSNSIFEKPPNSNGLLRLKAGFAFHLYINTAPCGDGRVYCLSRGSGVRNLGALRSKIENGEGTVLIPEDESMQAVDGIIGGRRLRIMCCSDKLLRRNFLGLQGALLACAIEPVYLSSLWVGKLYDIDHLQRAVAMRLKYSAALPNFPSGYKMNRPQLIHSSSVDGDAMSVKKKSMTYSVTYVNLNYADMLFDDDQHPMRLTKEILPTNVVADKPSNYAVRNKAAECIVQVLRQQRDCVEIIDSLTGKMVQDCNDLLTNREMGGVLGSIEKRRAGASSILCKQQLLQEFLKCAVLRAALLDTTAANDGEKSADAELAARIYALPSAVDSLLQSLTIMNVNQLIVDGTPPDLMKLLENISFLPAALNDSACLSYRRVKAKSSASYLSAKLRLDRMLSESHLGHWVRKSQDEEDHIIIGNGASGGPSSRGVMTMNGSGGEMTRAYDVDETSVHADDPDDADMLTIPNNDEKVSAMPNEQQQQLMVDDYSAATTAENVVGEDENITDITDKMSAGKVEEVDELEETAL